uniref:M.AgsIA n=1 Tax=Agrococcus sp. 25 TaxID=1682745 RepID=A0A0H5RYI1_9MICO|nr:M.AgsIA [Agrococcus sp. 25]
MKFDVILTNPPFQDSVNRKKTPHKLWIDFTLTVFDRLLVDGGSLVQVSPASISSPSNVVLSLMEENQTNVLRLETGHHFPQIGSTFCDYWIKKQENDPTPTTIIKGAERFDIELSSAMTYLPNDIGRLSLSVHHKVMFSGRPSLNVEWDYVTCHNIRRRDDPPSLVEQPSPAHPYPVFHTNNLTWWSSIRQDWADQPKVMWTRSGYTKPFYDSGVYGGTDMVYFVRVDDEAAGLALAANMNSVLMRYIYRTAKWSGFGNERVFAGLPDLPRDRALSDEEMFARFALTNEEVDHVRTALEPRRARA